MSGTTRAATARVAAALRGGALVGAVALVLAGCATGAGAGSGGDSLSSSGSGSAAASPSSGSGDSPTLSRPSASAGSGGAASAAPVGPVAADLTVTLDETGTGPTRTWHLTCGPDGGDHPDPAGACAALAAAGGAAAFEAPRKDAVCTDIYGGPQKAHVEGTVAGARVSADFSRTNGCGIARWNPLAPLLGSPGGA